MRPKVGDEATIDRPRQRQGGKTNYKQAAGLRCRSALKMQKSVANNGRYRYEKCFMMNQPKLFAPLLLFA